MRLIELVTDLGIDPELRLHLPIGALTILFGANSSGKTTLLEQLQGAFGNRTALRPPSPWGLSAEDAVVRVELDCVDIPGHPDNDLMRYSLAAYLNWELDQIPTDADGQPWSKSLGETLEIFGTRLLKDLEAARTAGEMIMTDAECCELADRMVAGLEVRIISGRASLYSAARLEGIGVEVEDACEPNNCTDARWWLEKLLVEGAVCFSRWDAPRTLLPSVFTLVLESSDIAGELREFIDQLTLAIFAGPDRAPSSEMWQIPFQQYPEDAYWNFRRQPQPDRWLPAPGVKDALEAKVSPQGLRPAIGFIADLIAERANELAPSFVREQGRIRISLMAPAFWTEIPSRLVVFFSEKVSEKGSHDFPLGDVGAGVARWVSAALRLACRELLNSSRLLADVDESTPKGQQAARDLLHRAEWEEDCFRRIEFRPPPLFNEVVLVDEPESHLHPGAVQSVARFLETLSRRSLAVVVATHHPLLFQPETPVATRVVLWRQGSRHIAEEVDDDVQASLRRIKKEVGLSEADIFLFTRLALFVEGPQDQAVMEAFFGQELAQAGVLLIPFHGTRNATALGDAEVLWRLGTKVGVLTDNTLIEEVANGGRSEEEKEIAALLRIASHHNRDIRVFGLKERDILCYLDAGVCRDVSKSDFPGWEASWRRASEQGVRNGRAYKSWIAKTYGLKVTTAREAAFIANQCRLNGKVPSELRDCVRRIMLDAAGGTASL
jgi:energy-coupling factor transporter ATP-binding protein EcfA2